MWKLWSSIAKAGTRMFRGTIPSLEKRSTDWVYTDFAKRSLLLEAYHKIEAHENINRPGYIRDSLSVCSSTNSEEEQRMSKEQRFLCMAEYMISEIELDHTQFVLDWSLMDATSVPEPSRLRFDKSASLKIARPRDFPLVNHPRQKAYKDYKCCRLYVLHISAKKVKGSVNWEMLLCERVDNKLYALQYWPGTPKFQT